MSELCLVTGGAGFIGSHLVDGLIAAGKTVRVFDDFSTGHRGNLAHHPQVEIVPGSLTDPSALRAAAVGAKVVFHLGAMASVAKSLEAPAECHAVCATGTLNVLQAARAGGARRVVYAASSSAYGTAADPDGLDEDTPLCTLSPYATAKLAGEFYMQSFAASYGLETVRLRFFNIFGPRQRADSPYSGVIALFADKLNRGLPPSVHGDGLQVRDFVYVANAVQALMKAADTPGVSGRVYNVGTGRGVTVLELAQTLNRLLGLNLDPIHGPARQGDVRFSRAKIGRIQAELGYEPNVSFEEGLRRTLDWYRQEGSAGKV